MRVAAFGGPTVGVSGASVLLHTPFYVTSETVPLADTAYLYSTQSSRHCAGAVDDVNDEGAHPPPSSKRSGEQVEGARWLHHEVDYARARI